LPNSLRSLSTNMVHDSRIAQQFHKISCKISGIPRLDQKAIPALLNDFRISPNSRRHHWFPGCHRFEERQGQPFGQRRQHERI
jgi:hypothetical protein